MTARAAGVLFKTLVVAGAATGLACQGASTSNGLEAYFRASGAQFVSGELPNDSTAPGPAVHTIASNNNRLYPGVQNKAISGTVENRAPERDAGVTTGYHSSGVAIGLAGDRGYWILPTGAEDATTSPPDLTFSTRGSFSPDLPAGAYTLIFRAIDPNGLMGPAKTEALTLDTNDSSPHLEKLGFFVIALEWGGPADLDLHVVAPATGGTGTVEVWSKKRNSLATRTPAQGPFTPDELAAAGVLDFDSNSGCVNDGRDREDVIWTEHPPAGHYLARVDASSLCGAPSVVWRLTVYYGGQEQPVASASGQLGDAATATPHVAGAGLTVWEQDVQ